MEKRAILAAVLMAALLILYQMLFMPSPEAPPPAPPRTEDAAPVQPGPAGVAQPPAAAPQPGGVTPLTPVPTAEVPARTAIVESPLYRGVISSSGGALQEWELKYRGEKPMVVRGVYGPAGLVIERPGMVPRPVPVKLSAESLRLGQGRQEGVVELAGEDGFGLRVVETLRFRADDYVIEHGIRIENRHGVAQGAGLLLSWTAPVEWPKDQPEKFQGQQPTRLVELGRDGVRREALTGAVARTSEGRWVGLESEWYLAALIPVTPGFKLIEAKQEGTVLVGVRASLPVLEPGQSWEGRVLTYVGPKEYGRLRDLGVGLEKSIYFGGFPMPESYGGLPMQWVVVPILWVMHLFYGFSGNYGVAIILLTVITKVLFFPLSLKSMRSMKAMQAVQPQVNALRAKHKNDPQRVQRETMELYRQHKINPLGGCLPMVVQIPIFYALYVALSVSVEIQNAPFICIGRLFGVDLWICDLAAHDPTYVLPILMGVSMFVQQKLTPIADPRQAKMMLFMPVVFTFMFLNLPSGLVLYWTVSNVLQIAQQLYMDRSAKPERVPVRAAKKA